MSGSSRSMLRYGDDNNKIHINGDSTEVHFYVDGQNRLLD